MSIDHLRVNLDTLRSQGIYISTATPVPAKPHRMKFSRKNLNVHPRHILMDHITDAVKEYLSLPNPKPWGSLSSIAAKHNTLPSTIACRINRQKNGKYKRRECSVLR